jgi:iron complex transport system ATP-binding protein
MADLLDVRNLSFSYGRKQILNNIDFSLEPAKIWALVGPNGSGKSTLLRCLAGLLSPSNGQVLLQGQEIQRSDRKWIARQICFLPQTQVALQHMRVYELLALGRSPYQNLGWGLSKADKEKIAWALNYMDLLDFQERPLESMSGGERQRAWLAMVLAQDTPIVLLDEPTTFLDLKHQWELLEKIRDIRNALNKSFIVVFHDINHAIALADQVLVLKDGSVFQSGTPSDVITSELLRAVYGIKAEVCTVSQYAPPMVVQAAH